jgi:hypothetical protein
MKDNIIWYSRKESIDASFQLWRKLKHSIPPFHNTSELDNLLLELEDVV